MLVLNSNKVKNDVHFLGKLKKSSFTQLYKGIRKKEGRILTDDQVKNLPKLSAHFLQNEWKLREESSARFVNHIKKKGFLTILEIGCGNGWFSHLLANVNKNRVIGQDINQFELEQAARCFGDENLSFINCTDFNSLPNNSFDLIVFNASIHYFPTPNDLFQELAGKLTSKGEIHVMDSPIYKTNMSAESANKRTQEYYTAKGVPGLSSFYFHHCQADFPIKKTYFRPSRINKIIGKKNPFQWIQIQL